MNKSASSYSIYLRLQISAMKPVNLTEVVQRSLQSLQDYYGTTA
jgi:hypothetical protein